MSDYTPTTEEVRDKYVGFDLSHTDDCTECPAEFDRWLAVHDAIIRADEREQAAHRVAKAIKHNRSCIVEDAPDCWCERSIAITAARGEDTR